jgi:hypothetical protein
LLDEWTEALPFGTRKSFGPRRLHDGVCKAAEVEAFFIAAFIHGASDPERGPSNYKGRPVDLAEIADGAEVGHVLADDGDDSVTIMVASNGGWPRVAPA